MRILGIDPGLTVTAFGVVEKHRGRLHLVASGYARTKSTQPMVERLTAIHTLLMGALRTHAPDAVSIESIFRHKSSESAIRLGQARGVALLAVGQCGYDPFEYNPMTIKRTVGSHGRADKQAVARMVGMLLGSVPDGPADLTDALAIAICHSMHARQVQLRGAVR
ncbi:MAG: crossover junction endodeoxyribonuclease RuvC [Kiritimatiellia bacterium]|jgi:crossover junction endodeoxyribonuclease RuvC